MLPSSILNICHFLYFISATPHSALCTDECCHYSVLPLPPYRPMLLLLLFCSSANASIYISVPASSARSHVSHVAIIARYLLPFLLSSLQPDASTSRLRGCDCLTFFFHFGSAFRLLCIGKHCIALTALSATFCYNLMLRHHG